MENKPTIDQIEVPAGMLAAALGGSSPESLAGADKTVAVEKALLWLAENPIVPSENLFGEWMSLNDRLGFKSGCEWAAVEWQRRMFLKPVPVIPEEVKAAITKHFGSSPADWVKDLAVEAYELGKRASREGK